jgi:hypothetical protein
MRSKNVMCKVCGIPLKTCITLYMPGYFCSMTCGRIHRLSKNAPSGSLMVIDLKRINNEEN